MGSTEKLVVVTTAASPSMASVVAQILLEAGIPAVCGGHPPDIDILLDQDPLGDRFVEIRVPRSLLERAKRVLAELRRDPESADPS